MRLTHTDSQTDTDTETVRQIHKQATTLTPSDTQANTMTSSHADRQIDRHTHTERDRHTHTQTVRQRNKDQTDSEKPSQTVSHKCVHVLLEAVVEGDVVVGVVAAEAREKLIQNTTQRIIG